MLNNWHINSKLLQPIFWLETPKLLLMENQVLTPTEVNRAFTVSFTQVLFTQNF